VYQYFTLVEAEVVEVEAVGVETEAVKYLPLSI
jgi:hypothetical protein